MTVSGFTITNTSLQRDQKCGQSRPEKSVQGVQGWPRPFAVERGDLLSEGEDFEGGVASTAEEDTERGEEGEEEFRHGLTVLSWRRLAFTTVGARNRKFLISEQREVSSTDTS